MRLFLISFFLHSFLPKCLFISGRLLRIGTVILLILPAALFSPAFSQVSINPTILFIHDDDPYGHLTLRNTSDTEQEVEITPRFGYPESTESGELQMNYNDPEKEAQYGLTENIRIFPRRFILKPAEQQRVRLQVDPLSGRPDGLYWIRLNIAFNKKTKDVEILENSGIATRIHYRIQQNIGIFYHHGSTQTGITVDDVETVHEEGRLNITTWLTRSGNSPYMGSMRARLLDDNNNEIRSGEWVFSLYTSRMWPVHLDVEGLPSGPYRLELEFRTRRGDISPDDLAPAPLVTESRMIRL